MINSNSIYIANNARTYVTHVVYLLFMLNLRMSAYHMCLPYVFCSTLLSFGKSGCSTPAASKMEPFVTKVNSWKSLLLLERAPSYITYIHVYTYIHVCIYIYIYIYIWYSPVKDYLKVGLSGMYIYIYEFKLKDLDIQYLCCLLW